MNLALPRAVAGLLRLHAPPVLASYVIAPLLADYVVRLGFTHVEVMPVATK